VREISAAGVPDGVGGRARRTFANLDHPHIVPVYDVGATADCPCFVVSKYIDGTDLASLVRGFRLSVQESVEYLSWKVGIVALVLGVMHFINLIAFTATRKRAITPVAPKNHWEHIPEVKAVEFARRNIEHFKSVIAERGNEQALAF
jgi:hypothetical protein